MEIDNFVKNEEELEEIEDDFEKINEEVNFI
jgi:hypothetical protein